MPLLDPRTITSQEIVATSHALALPRVLAADHASPLKKTVRKYESVAIGCPEATNVMVFEG